MKEERQNVCFNFDLFLHQESNLPVSHLHHEKLTFNNKKHEFHRKLIQTGEVMVISEGTEMMPRAGADYSMLSTTASSAVSDHKRIKSHHATKEPNKDRAGGAGKSYKPHREHKSGKKLSESKTNSRERVCEGGTSRLEMSSSSSLRKSTENREKEESKNMVNVAFKEPKFSTRESRGGGGGQVDLRAVSKRPSSTTESSNLSIKKLKSLKECKEESSITVSSQLSSTTAAPPSTCLEKKGMKEKSHCVKMRRESPVVKRWTDSDSNSEDETLSRSVQSGQSTSSSSCSTSSSDSEFEPLQMQNQGHLHFIVDHLPSEHSNDDRSSEVEKAMKAVPTIQDSRLFMDSDSDDVEESHPYSQEVPSHVLKLDTKNLKMLEKKNPNSCKRENVLKEDKLGRAYTAELVDLHRRLMALRERNILQQIVNLIEKTGHFNVTKTTFDFDLFSLDESTVRKLQSHLQAKRT